MASFLYNFGKAEILNNNIDLLNDTIKIALFTASYVADKDADEDFADVTNEISGTGYTAGGNTMTNPAVAVDDANDRAEFSADDEVWANATFTARAAVIYKSTGTPGTSTLIAYIDFAEDKSAAAEDFTIAWNAEGIIQF